MDILTKHASSLLPEYNKKCGECLNFFNHRDIVLERDQIFRFDLGLFFPNNPNFILEIKPHLCNKPWRILGQFFSPHPSDGHTLIIPIISPKKCLIKRGQILFHAEIISPNAAFIKIKGNFIVNRRVIYTNNFFFLEQDEIFFSDDDDDAAANEIF